MRHLIPAALLLTFAFAACGDDDDNATTTPTHTAATSVTATATTAATATATQPATPTHTPASTAQNVCQANPDPAPASELVIELPEAGDSLSSPVTITGQVNAFEAVFQVAIKDPSGNDIATQTGHAAEGQTLSAFEQEVPFTVSQTMPACIWVFQRSAMDDSVIKVGQVPVVLVP